MAHTGSALASPIEVDGRFIGAAVPHELGICFVAVDARVADMDRSVWPTIDHARGAARQMLRQFRKGFWRVRMDEWLT